jgi:glycosyltransferase involved in cell wall biosynthesis
LKILEAMAASVPVISTPLGAEGLAVTPDENILFADPDNADAWVRHLRRLAGEKDERARLVNAARGLVQSRYDWQTLGQALCTTYETWLREKT